jgi:hypothetical protein
MGLCFGAVMVSVFCNIEISLPMLERFFSLKISCYESNSVNICQ